MSKTVLFIRANPVRPDSRVEKEVEALVAHGFNVTVLAWDRSENYPIRKEALNDSLTAVDTYRIGIKAQFGSGIKNLKNLAKFQIAIRQFLRKNTFDSAFQPKGIIIVDCYNRKFHRRLFFSANIALYF